MTAALELHRSHDEQTRRQIRELLDETLFVEAGAGTGKTRALVERYVALVLSGRRVDQLVAITFTEKAAAELRDRVRGELERRAEDGESDAALLQTALSSLDRAQISTIHAFALHVLRSFAAEQGIDPSFRVQDEVAAERRFQERWRVYLEDAGRDPDVCEAVSRTLALGLTTYDIERLAQELWRHGAIAEMLSAAPLEAQPALMPDLQTLHAELAGLHPERAPSHDRLRQAIEAAVAGLNDLIATPDDEREALLAVLAPSLMSLKSRQMGLGTNWGGAAGIAGARDGLRNVLETLAASLTSLRSAALSRLLPIVVRFVIEESQSRLRDGELMFDDLILRLRDLLRDNAGARGSLRGRYAALLIDEFQDTDPLQVDIALAYACDPDGGPLDPGRIFVVGDPKQSIYRFRRADMAVYAATRGAVEQQRGHLPELMLNRRSRACVLEFVNEAFAGVIGSGDSPEVQPPYRPVQAERREVLTGPGVAWIGRLLAMPARAARRHEARQIAAFCRAALQQCWQVWDRDLNAVRAARYGDIAILVPTRTILQPLERALASAGVPYRVEGGSLIYATQEMRDLINCLTAIDDPTDDIAVVAALRSPAYACSDVELAVHRLDGGSFNYLVSGLDESQGRMMAALLDLRTFHLARGQGSLAWLLGRFIAQHRFAEAGIYDAGNRNAFRRALFAIEQARAFEGDGPQSLRSFIDWLERRAGDAILDHEGAGLDDDEDAVRVLTIHAAKGLEFPIVFVAGLGVGPSNQRSVLGLDRASGSISVSVGSRTRNANIRLGPVDRIEAQERAHESAERDRLLYVAATRARDHLMLFLYHHQKARNTFAQRLIETGACSAAMELPELAATADTPLAPFAGLGVEPAAVSDDEFEAERARHVAAARPASVTSATALGRLSGEGKEREDESEPWARGRAGTHRGRAVHAGLQVIPWDAGEETLTALARAQAVAEAVPQETDRIAELLRRALGSRAAVRARTARRASREVPFALVEEGIIVEGFVDLVLESDDGLEIIDWKTDAVPAQAVPQRLLDYELQAGLYVLAIEAATNRPVRRVTYAFVDPGVEVSPGEPATLAARARERLRTMAHA